MSDFTFIKSNENVVSVQKNTGYKNYSVIRTKQSSLMLLSTCANYGKKNLVSIKIMKYWKYTGTPLVFNNCIVTINTKTISLK